MSIITVLKDISNDNLGSEAPLLRNHHIKTLDAGYSGHTLSCGAAGDILQLGCYHPAHGMVVASPFAQFDGTRFYDLSYVREYRKKLLNYVRSGTRGFGIQLGGQLDNLKVEFLDNRLIVATYSIDDIQASTTVSLNRNSQVVQSTAITSKSLQIKNIDYTLDLSVSVNRASYGQLTEGGPIAIPSSKNDFRLFDSSKTWSIINENLDAMIEGSLYINGQAVDLSSSLSEETSYGIPVTKVFHGKFQLHPWQTITTICTFEIKAGIEISPLLPCPDLVPLNLKGGWKLPKTEAGMIIRGNLDYILGNCTLPVGKDAVCFITDHVALPLGWNRDNYWQIRYLLDVYRKLEILAYPTTAQIYRAKIHDNIKGHLQWVFQVAQRPQGYWHRSYLATGIPKDGPVFQLDQQCYPLLELCDFYEQFPNDRQFVARILSSQKIPRIYEMLESRRDDTTGLYVTEETPGDDAVEHPFHFSSHVLLWYTYTRLAALLDAFPKFPSLSGSELKAQAILIRDNSSKHFISKHPKSGQTLFAYLTDGAGNHTFYHDANDIPTLFTLDWRFINTPTLHKIWTQTMDFALSPLNDGGYYPEGEFGGLGSVHTKGPWPLGYAQEFIYAHLTGNDVAQDDSWRRITGSMFWDGLFPEAVDCHTGDCVSKAWFSWPGSMIGSALLRFGLKPDFRSTTCLPESH